MAVRLANGQCGGARVGGRLKEDARWRAALVLRPPQHCALLPQHSTTAERRLQSQPGARRRVARRPARGGQQEGVEEAAGACARSGAAAADAGAALRAPAEIGRTCSVKVAQHALSHAHVPQPRPPRDVDSRAPSAAARSLLPSPLSPTPPHAHTHTQTKQTNKQTTKIILTKDVPNVGVEGELLSVPVGYWRNYLKPGAVAKIASDGILECVLVFLQHCCLFWEHPFKSRAPAAATGQNTPHSHKTNNNNCTKTTTKKPTPLSRQIRKRKEDALRAKLEEKAAAQAFANALATIGKFVIKKRAGDKDQIFGSVTRQDVADAVFQQTGRSIAELELGIPDVKAVGSYEVSVKLHP